MISLTTQSAHQEPPAMKILKIFGLVVAIHAIAFIVIFANPGCRSTPTRSPEPEASTGVQRPSRNGRMAPYSDRDPQPVAASNAYQGGDDYVPVTPVSLEAYNADTGGGSTLSQGGAIQRPDGRSAPTRPGSGADATAEIIPASTYVVQKGDSLWSIARKNNLTTAELAAANNMPANSVLQIGRRLLVPSKGIAGPGPVSAVGGATSAYTVKSGDTLSTIASRHGTTIAAIRSANNLRGDLVRVGQELKIPGASAAGAPGVATQDAAPAPAANSGTAIHVVKMGETLGAIARRYNVTVTEIAKANNITDPAKIRIGQELAIPGARSAAPGPAPVSIAPSSTAPSAEPAPVVPVRDIDDALPPDFIDAPVIQVEDPGAPKIE